MRTHTSGNSQSQKADNLNTKGLLSKQIAESRRESRSFSNPFFLETFMAEELEEAKDRFQYR
jgi:hypothetical protein